MTGPAFMTGQSTFGQATPASYGSFGVYPAWNPLAQQAQQYGPPQYGQGSLQQLLNIVPQQLQQILQVVPQQVQQLQNLQQQILQLQQWVQAVPLQLLQLQQLIHHLAHQQQLQQSNPIQAIQPFGSSVPGLSAFGGGFLQPNVGITSQGLGYGGQTAIM
jgi:hypothetical protein